MTSVASRRSNGGIYRADRRFHSSHTRLIRDTPGHVRRGAVRGPYGSRVQPSSLIFVAIIAIWAAFLVQHWVRRREALSTARSVDRFSEAIRLLDRTPARVSAEPRPAPQVYAALASPLVARSGGGSGAVVAAGSGAAAGVGSGSGAAAAEVLAGPAPAGPRPTATAPNRRGPRLALWGRRVRGLSFLGLVALVPVTVVLSALSVLRWTSVLVAVLSLILGLVMLRYAAVHERTLAKVGRSMAASELSGQRAAAATGSAARPAPRRRSAAPARRVVATPGGAAPAVAPAASAADAPAQETSESATATADQTPAAQAPAALTPAVQVPAAAAVTIEPAGERASRRAAYAQYSADGTWEPVAVPPPTYTLKARAAHPQPEPAEVTATPEPMVAESAADDTHVRAVGD